MAQKSSRNKSFKRGKGQNCRKNDTIRQNRSDSRMDTDSDRSNSSNDPAWYAADQSILRDAASIPFSWSNGTPIMLQMPTLYPKGFSVPGIQTIELCPSVGYADAPTSPINIAATATYSFVRHANSGHTNYDAPDLMLYITAMSQVYSYINYLMRLYGMATLYSQRNRYLPAALVESNWANFDDVAGHLADFRYGINVLINKAASLAVPASMTIFKRHAFLYQNVYTEGTSIKDQLYMYVPAGFYIFGIDADGAGQLTISDFAGTRHTMQQLLDYGNAMLAPILSSEDMNIMSGDILKAYGADNLIKLVTLPESYPILPFFDIGVLEQMKNTTPNYGAASGTLRIYQDKTKGFLLSLPSTTLPTSDTGRGDWINGFRLLTTTTYETTPELVMESTRLMTSVHHTSISGDNTIYYLNCGSEFALNTILWEYQADGTLANTNINGIDFLTASNGDAILNKARLLSNFRFHPIVMFGTTTDGLTAYPLYDLDNYAVLSQENVQRLHEAALLNELHVPSIARA